MVFSSWHFIILYLPITFIIYFELNRHRQVIIGKLWLVAASLFFYAYWDVSYLPLILISIFLNFAIGTGLAQGYQRSVITNEEHYQKNRTIILTIGIVANLSLLGYYKYTNFALININSLLGTHYALHHIALPLAISFFTFTQIVYLVDSYRGETAHYNLLNYALFVTFFPHLIAGPIVHHKHIMPQFESRWTLVKRYPNILKGLCIFSIGLFKKSVIADSFAIWATAGFDGGAPLHIFSAWVTSLSYTFQLYFDFSGYCDMAIGSSLLFNIWLPNNFNSPYKALNIQDFWRRWHITLSNFLRDYLYIPLGGNRCSTYRMYLNLFITFLLGGLWHGATWMFIIWGALHGSALIIHRMWTNLKRPMHPILAWGLTFNFINITWIFFRAKTMDDAFRILRGMVDFRSVITQSSMTISTKNLAWGGWMSDVLLKIFHENFIGELFIYPVLILSFIIVYQKNSLELLKDRLSMQWIFYYASLFSLGMYFVLAQTTTVFLYFNF